VVAKKYIGSKIPSWTKKTPTLREIKCAKQNPAQEIL